MEISQLDFVILTVYSVCFGALLGAVYDIIRVSRVIIGVNDKSGVLASIFVAVGDVVFVSACGVMSVMIAYAYNSGKLRAVIFFGLAVGFVAYYFTVGKLVMVGAGALARAIRWTAKRIVAAAQFVAKKLCIGKIKKKGAKNDAQQKRNAKKKAVAQ